jgi:hypothetical protein
MPDDNMNVDLEKIVANAIGEKPFSVQGNFNNVMMQKAADIISGKREEIAAQYSMTHDDTSDSELDSDPSEDELDDILDDEDADDESTEDDLDLSDEDLDDILDDEDDEDDDQAE